METIKEFLIRLGGTPVLPTKHKEERTGTSQKEPPDLETPKHERPKQKAKEKETDVERKGPGVKHHTAEGTNMGTFKKWSEYINEKGKTIEKPEVKKIADYDGPQETSPAPAKAPKSLEKDMEPPKAAGKPAPYKNAAKAPKPKKQEPGLAEKGDQKLVYEPDTSHTLPNPMGKEGKCMNHWPKSPKTKTEQFIDKTSKMTTAEFVNYMTNEVAVDAEEIPMVTAYTAGRFHPHPPEAISYIASLATKNDRIMDSLVHEIKRQGGLKKMLEVLMDHPESFDGLTDLLGDEEAGPGRCNAMARSMDNVVSKFQADQDDMYESVAPPFGTDDESGEDDTEPSDDSPEGEEVGEDAQGDENQQDDENIGNDEEMNAGPDSSEGPSDKGNEKPTPESPEQPPKKLKKKFAHDHMLQAMSKIQHMKEKMKGYCSM